jgi:hypothetical protein
LGTGVLSPKWSGQVIILTTQLPIEPRLRMSGAIPALPLYALMAWTGTTACLR